MGHFLQKYEIFVKQIRFVSTNTFRFHVVTYSSKRKRVEVVWVGGGGGGVHCLTFYKYDENNVPDASYICCYTITVIHKLGFWLSRSIPAFTLYSSLHVLFLPHVLF